MRCGAIALQVARFDFPTSTVSASLPQGDAGSNAAVQLTFNADS